MQPAFEFYQGYTLPSGPQSKSIVGCLDHVAQLPATDSPHVLGLDSNAEVTYQMNRFVIMYIPSLKLLKL